MPIIAQCPVCKGTGKVLKELPPMANPNAPGAQPHRRPLETCPRCGGRGVLGTD